MNRKGPIKHIARKVLQANYNLNSFALDRRGRSVRNFRRKAYWLREFIRWGNCFAREMMKQG